MSITYVLVMIAGVGEYKICVCEYSMCVDEYSISDVDYSMCW